MENESKWQIEEESGDKDAQKNTHTHTLSAATTAAESHYS